MLVGSEDSVMSPLAAALAARRVEVVTGRLAEPGEDHGRIGMVVNIGAVGSIAGLRQAHAAGFADAVSAVLKPLFLGTKHGVRILSKAGGGCVVNIVGGVDDAAAGADNMILAAARGAAANLSRSAALHAGKSGYRVRVNSLHLPVLPRSETEASALVATVIYLGSADAEFVTGIELALAEAGPS